MPSQVAAGNQKSFMGFNDPNDGLFIGNTLTNGVPTSPAAGSSTGGGMLKVLGIKNAPAAIPDSDAVIDTGDDGEVMYEFDFVSIAARGFVAEVAVQDLSQVALWQNYSVQNLAGARYTALDTDNMPLFDTCFLLQSRAIRSDAQSNGSQRWNATFFPHCTARYLGRATYAERTPAVFRWLIRPQLTSHDMAGFTVLDANSNQKDARKFEWEDLQYPITMHAFKGNNVATVFPTDYTPVSTSLSAVVLERVAAALASVQTTAPVGFTLSSAASTLGKRGIFIYQFAQ